MHRATLFRYIMRWQNTRCTKSGPSLLQNEMYILHCLLTHVFTLMGSDACHALPTICLILQGLRMCCRCSEATHAHSAHKLLKRFTGSLSSFTHTISRDSTVYIYIYTSSEARRRRASLLWHTVDSVLAKALWCDCFNESTSNVSYVDDRELGNWSKVMPMATMWQCFWFFRVIMQGLARYACMYMNLSMQVSLACLVCRTQAAHFRSRCEGLLSRRNYQ